MRFPENPFNPGTPSRPGAFIGRQDVIRSLEGALFSTGDQALVSIIGQPRIGKTSLLWQLEERWKTRDDVRVLYFDSLDLQAQPPEDWLGELVQRIVDGGERAGTGQDGDASSPTMIWNWLRSILAGAKRRTILVLDEFDALAKAVPYDYFFFSHLRALLTAQSVLGKLTLITATRQHLDALRWSEDMAAGSPFPNIAGHQEKIGLLTESEARALLQKGRAFLGEDEIDFLYRLAGPHPHFLQAAGAAAWHAKLGGEEGFETTVRGRFGAISHSAYLDILRTLNEEVREDLYARAFLGKGMIEREGKLRDDLLIDDLGEIYSEGMRSFCILQVDAVKDALRKRFERLPRALRRLLWEHALSGAPVPEETGYILQEFGWLGDDYKVLDPLRCWAPVIMEGEGHA